MPEATKHPKILPKRGHITDMVIRDMHERTGHQGREHVLAALRCEYWIVDGNSAIRRVLSRCVSCRKRQVPVVTQVMSDLPTERVTSGEPPFTRVGTDYFGPFYTKNGRKQSKRYGVVFTCLATRAVHIEVADSLDTSSFIGALRRFQARRGQVKYIRSDNGTNFVGAERELRKEVENLNKSRIHESMLKKGITWVFNAPGASHHGGVWERQIRSIRRILGALLKEQSLTDESLRTLMCEVEAVINSRPLTTVSSDPSDLERRTTCCCYVGVLRRSAWRVRGERQQPSSEMASGAVLGGRVLDTMASRVPAPVTNAAKVDEGDAKSEGWRCRSHRRCQRAPRSVASGPCD